jgi:class 3 adenylate cyclase/predicted ATPase
VDDVVQLLEQLGLAQYAKRFAENDVDLNVLRQLTDQELKELGLTLGHRTKLRSALRCPLTSDISMKGDSPFVREEKLGRGEAERRQVSVMFCDLVASTALSTQLDPEDYRELIRAYQDTCADVVKRFDGFLAKFMGDGLLIYFGWPQAHEDDAERAINTALGIIAAIQSLAACKAGTLSVRVGIATGRVVVGDIVGEGASQEAAIVGEAPNLAARLQAIAEPNTAVVDNMTHSLAGGLFESANLGAQALKGFSAPVTSWRITGSRPVASRFEATRMRALTPFVRREEEIGVLDRRWRRSCSGEGQVVLLSGEAGIGKSRIVSAFMERLDGQPYTSLRYQCSPYHINSALYPIIEQLAFAASIHSSDPPDRKLDKLEALLALANRPTETTIPLIAPLLSIPLRDRYPPVNVSPQRRKQLTLATLVDLFQGLAEQRPVLFHFEDAHWIDPTSRELLDLIVARTLNLAALVVISFRPEFSFPWTGEPHVTFIALKRLEAQACAHLARQIAGSAALPSEILNEIAARADGVPLFIEEMTKTVLEAATSNTKDALPHLSIPASIEASLLARLDRLGPAKEIAQIAAAIGRTFRHDVLAAVATLDEEDLEAAIGRLEAAGLVYRWSAAESVAYEFKHALVCDAAYQSLLKSRRQQHHGHIAEVLEAQFSEVIEPELLAHHYTEAGRLENAVDYWLKAGQRSMQRSAHVEAERHLRKGLELLAALPAGTPRFRREITLLNALGVCLMPTRGFSSPEIASVFAQAAELAEQNKDIRGLFVSLRGKGQYHYVSGDLTNARSDAQRILTLAEQMRDHDWLIEAHHLNWGVLCFTGEFVDARRHAEEGEALYQRERDHHLTYVYSGHDPGSCCRGHAALIFGQLGYVERARELIRDALALAERVAHPLSIAIALWQSGLLHQLLREPDAMGAVGERMVRHSRETGLRPMVPIGKIFRGDALTHRASLVDGIAQIREGIVELRGIGSLLAMPSVFGTLADAFARHGDIDEGLATIHEGLAMADTNGDRFSLPEIHRVRGNLLLARPTADRDAAEAAYRQAIEIAQIQQARLLELRAATTMARLWGENGRRAAARELLTPVYERFSDGFDTPDLRDAKSLLGELA